MGIVERAIQSLIIWTDGLCLAIVVLSVDIAGTPALTARAQIAIVVLVLLRSVVRWYSTFVRFDMTGNTQYLLLPVWWNPVISPGTVATVGIAECLNASFHPLFTHCPYTTFDQFGPTVE